MSACVCACVCVWDWKLSSTISGLPLPSNSQAWQEAMGMRSYLHVCKDAVNKNLPTYQAPGWRGEGPLYQRTVADGSTHTMWGEPTGAPASTRRGPCVGWLLITIITTGTSGLFTCRPRRRTYTHTHTHTHTERGHPKIGQIQAAATRRPRVSMLPWVAL